VAGLVEAAGDPYSEAVAAHLRGNFRDSFGELGAVANEDQADHGYDAGRSAGASVAAAVSRRSHDEVAPGSWCPALRSPR